MARLWHLLAVFRPPGLWPGLLSSGSSWAACGRGGALRWGLASVLPTVTTVTVSLPGAARQHSETARGEGPLGESPPFLEPRGFLRNVETGAEAAAACRSPAGNRRWPAGDSAGGLAGAGRAGPHLPCQPAA